MSKKVKITNFKTKRINKYTGGKIDDYINKSLCFEDEDDTNPDNYTLKDSFIAPDGTYLGNYATGWWYFKANMLVCLEYPLGVGIVLKHTAKRYKYLEDYKTDGRIGCDDIKGYFGFSHRGGQLFKIGDRFFDKNYEPKEADYTKTEWSKFIADREKNISVKRGVKIIRNWEEAKQSAINISKYLG